MSNPVTPWMHHRSWRNNNPGDLRPRAVGEPAWPGQTEEDTGPGGPFAIFGTASEGWAALDLWLRDAYYNRGLVTVKAMIGVFAPPSENDTASYAAGVAKALGVGLDNPLAIEDDGIRQTLMKAIAHWEDYQAKWPQSEIDEGQALANSEWPQWGGQDLEGDSV